MDRPASLSKAFQAHIEGETVRALHFDGSLESVRTVVDMGVLCDMVPDKARENFYWLAFFGRAGLTMAAPGEVIVVYPDNSCVALHPDTFDEHFETIG